MPFVCCQLEAGHEKAKVEREKFNVGHESVDVALVKLKQRDKKPNEGDFVSFGLESYLGHCEGLGNSHLFYMASLLTLIILCIIFLQILHLLLFL